MTGGVSVVNTNNFDAGLDKIMARSNGYYTLAYSPTEKFDRKLVAEEIKEIKDRYAAAQALRATKISAKYVNGILEVTIPKDEKKVLKSSIKVN